MIFIVVGLIAAVIGGFLAQSKGKNIGLWALLCGLIPIAILFLAFMKPEETPIVRVEVHDKKDRSTTERISYSSTVGNAPGYDVSKWNALLTVDDDVRAARDTVSQYGREFEEELAEKYLVLNDRQHIGAIRDKVVARAEEKRRAHIENMERLAEDKKEKIERSRTFVYALQEAIRSKDMYDDISGKKVTRVRVGQEGAPFFKWVLVMWLQDGKVEVRSDDSRSFCNSDADFQSRFGTKIEMHS